MQAAFVERHCRPVASALIATLSDWSRRLSGLLGAMLIASLLAACGGGDEGSPQIPTLLSQPSDQSVIEGSGATFTVSANGAAPLAYQWASSPDGTTFTPIAGASGTSYSTGAAALALNGMRYRVTVSNAVGSVTSSAVHLTVTQLVVAPAITVQPADQAVTAPATASFNVTATGTAPSYEWQSSSDAGVTFNPVAGAADAPSLALTNTTTAQSGQRYRVRVSNSAGNVTSSAAQLTVSPTPMAPMFTTQPAAQTIVAGQAVDFTVAAAGTPAPTIQWRFNGTNLVNGAPVGGACSAFVSGATGTTLSLMAVPISCDTAVFTAIASNGIAPDATSTSALLTVNPTPVAPSITSQPLDFSVVAPGTATFTAAASGVPTPTAQWQQSTDGGVTWANINGATSSTYTIPATTVADDAKRFRAVFTNASGSTTSNPATLTVNPAPVAPMVTFQPADASVQAPNAAEFTAIASGTPAPSIQWQQSTDGGVTWSTPPGAGGNPFQTGPTTAGDNGKRFRAVFTNVAGTATSNAATLTVTAPTTVGIGPAGGTVTGPNGAQAIIPAGALSTVVDIAIANAGLGAPGFSPPGVHPAGSIYEFTPHGTTFAQPVVVRVPFDPALVPAGTTPRLYHAQPGGSFTEVPGTTVNGLFLVASVNSFSYFGPGQSSARFSELASSCARETLSGYVYCWSDQGNIAFDSGFAAPGTADFAEPTRLPPMSLTSIVGGHGFVCGLNVADVWCIGDDTITAASDVAAPNARRRWAKIRLPDGVVLFKLAAGGSHVCGIGAPNSPDQTAVGRVYCWGDDLRGQLGRGSFVSFSAVVAPIAGSQLYVALAAGGNHTCAARQLSGAVDCWGDNSLGQVVNAALPFSATATPTPRGVTVDPRQGALLPLCGLTVNGTAWCWGDNFYGQMGNGTAGTGQAGENLRDPSAVPGLRFKSLSTGLTMCGIALDDRVYCWGRASGGALGNGSDTANAGTNDAGKQKTPVRVSVPEGLTFASMTDTGLAKCARTTDNVVYCWGPNLQYRLGTGFSLPALVNVPNEIKDMNLTQEMP